MRGGNDRHRPVADGVKIWYEKGAWINGRARRFAAARTPESIGSIAVIRHAALGDMVLTRAFLLEARRFFPNARITLSLASNYLAGAPEDLVDRLHVVRYAGAGALARLSDYRSLGGHDMLFDLAATPRSYWITSLNRAGLKAGFPYREMQRRLHYDLALPRSNLIPEVEAMLQFLQVFGAETRNPPVYELPGEPLRRARPYVIYFPGASHARKRWLESRFVDLIPRALKANPGLDHLIMSGIGPEEDMSPMVAALSSIEGVGGLPPGDLAACTAAIKGARLVVTNDNGIRNVAIAAGTPTVGIFFSTVPYRYWPREGRHAVVFEPDGSMPMVARVLDAVNATLAAGS